MCILLTESVIWGDYFASHFWAFFTHPFVHISAEIQNLLFGARKLVTKDGEENGVPLHHACRVYDICVAQRDLHVHVGEEELCALSVTIQCMFIIRREAAQGEPK